MIGSGCSRRSFSNEGYKLLARNCLVFNFIVKIAVTAYDGQYVVAARSSLAGTTGGLLTSPYVRPERVIIPMPASSSKRISAREVFRKALDSWELFRNKLLGFVGIKLVSWFHLACGAVGHRQPYEVSREYSHLKWKHDRHDTAELDSLS
jgi:hypothetical protein